MDVTPLWSLGYASLGTLLTPQECAGLIALYDQPERFRSRIEMARFRFGRGEYQYFAAPLPECVANLRAAVYRQLVPTAREWNAALGADAELPPTHEEYLAICRDSGQVRPTPLLLRYVAGDYNCLHQDLYGKVAFPFQVVIGLNEPSRDYTGGELLLVEQQPRAQSIGHAIVLGLGEGVVITTRHRPARGKRGYYRTNVRHGVSPLRTGRRHTLGIIFHDAE